jgi:hemoglobin
VTDSLHLGVQDDQGEGLHESQVYGRIGEEGFQRLVGAFYRAVARDDVLKPMYPENQLAAAEERLRDFLVGRFGGPPRYVARRGHPRLRMRHMPFSIDVRASRRWLELMDRAFLEAALP